MRPALVPAHQACGALLRQGDGWSHQEDWGCWAVAPGQVALRLPLGVVRVIVADLIAEGYLRLEDQLGELPISVIERIRDRVRAL